ncbi:hypothetical protein AMTRI_Chr09g12210 [Amborella trichopoda]
MKGVRSWRSPSLSKNPFLDAAGSRRFSSKSFTSFGCFILLFMLFLILITMKHQYEHIKMDNTWYPFASTKRPQIMMTHFDHIHSLPRGIVESTSDMELKPLWETSTLTDKNQNHKALLAIPVGIKQKKNVNAMVQKFLAENFAIILFHYDGNVDGWHDLGWSDRAIHILAHNQTKWWFAKRFLHPDVVSIYDYIFLWDEDLGVENFHPGRYLRIMKAEGLEISQPALDPNQSEIHHRITIRNKTGKVHRRMYASRGSLNCSDASMGPPCTGWVEGMAPVFSRASWHCTWHLIQNDLIHGWGLDMKLGYCSQGDRTKNVGVIDSEFIIHLGIPSLGGSSANKQLSSERNEAAGPADQSMVTKVQGERVIDLRSQIRRQSTAELEIFRKRWDRAVRDDKEWADPYKHKKGANT